MTELLTPAEAGKIARVSSRTILRLAADGAFPALRVGRQAVRIERAGFMRDKKRKAALAA